MFYQLRSSALLGFHPPIWCEHKYWNSSRVFHPLRMISLDLMAVISGYQVTDMGKKRAAAPAGIVRRLSSSIHIVHHRTHIWRWSYHWSTSRADHFPTPTTAHDHSKRVLSEWSVVSCCIHYSGIKSRECVISVISITSAFWILHSMMTHTNQYEDEGADFEIKAGNLDAKIKEEVN